MNKLESLGFKKDKHMYIKKMGACVVFLEIDDFDEVSLRTTMSKSFVKNYSTKSDLRQSYKNIEEFLKHFVIDLEEWKEKILAIYEEK